MGAFFNSYSIPGDVHEAVDQKIKAWLSRKGFQEPPDPVLDHTKEGERAYYLFWNDRWTVVLYSDFEEEERLQFELGNADWPLLHLWLHDSDLWGYELYRKNRPRTAFNSNPKYFGPSEQAAAPNDIPLLMELCSIRGVTAPQIETLQKKKGIFQENACQAFAKAIGAGPAASQYAYESDLTPAPEGFSVEHRRFRKRGFDPMRNFDLHEKPRTEPQAETPFPVGMPTVTLGFRVLMEIMRIVMIPVGWFLRLYLKVKLESGGIPGMAKLIRTPSIQREYVFEDGRLVNRKRRCRIRLSEGAVPSDSPGMLPFKVGGKEIFSRTMSAEETRHTLTGLRREPIEEETDFLIGTLPAKWIRTKFSGKPGRHVYACFIQGPQAVYYFSSISDTALDPPSLEAFRRTMGSFEVMNPSPEGETAQKPEAP